MLIEMYKDESLIRVSPRDNKRIKQLESIGFSKEKPELEKELVIEEKPKKKRTKKVKPADKE